MKLRLLAVAMAALGIGTALAQDVTSEKGKTSYAVGYDLGRSLAESKVDVDQATLYRAIQDGLARKSPALPADKMAQLLQAMQQRLLARAKSDFDKAKTENKAASDWFLAKNHAKAFVKTLPNGIQYRVIEEGNGPSPRANGQALIMYKASISTGQVFATSYGGDGVPAAPIPVVIGESPMPGLRIIMPMMRQGAHWEIMLPPDQAYGNDPRSPIGPSQAVLIDIKMIEAAYSGPQPPAPPGAK